MARKECDNFFVSVSGCGGSFAADAYQHIFFLKERVTGREQDARPDSELYQKQQKKINKNGK